MNNKALIIGISGQDGSYLFEFFSYEINESYGQIRKSSTFNSNRVD